MGAGVMNRGCVDVITAVNSSTILLSELRDSGGRNVGLTGMTFVTRYNQIDKLFASCKKTIAQYYCQVVSRPTSLRKLLTSKWALFPGAASSLHPFQW